MIACKKLTSWMLANEEREQVTPDSNVELSRLMNMTYEEIRSIKDSSLTKGLIRKVKDVSTGGYMLVLTEKGRLDALQTQPIQRQAGASGSKVMPVVRRAGVTATSTPKPSKPVNEAEHFDKCFNQLTLPQLAFYHLILANSLGEDTFQYLSFKFLNGVLRTLPHQVANVLNELETIGLIKLEGFDRNAVRMNHSYPFLAKRFPNYCTAKNPELNEYLKELYLSPHKIDESELRFYEGMNVQATSKKITTTTHTQPQPQLSTVQEVPNVEQGLSDSEMRYHTASHHSSMPEVPQPINQQYWTVPHSNSIYSFNPSPVATMSYGMPMNTNVQPQVVRNPLTILIDGDQQSLRSFLKEAKLDRLRSGDSVYLFSAPGAHSQLPSELTRRLEELKENVYFKRITSEIRRPNTVDQLLMTRLTMLLTADRNRDFIILSNDKGFAGAITMLNDTYNLRRGQIQLQSIAIL